MSTRTDALLLTLACVVGLLVAPAGWPWYRAIVGVFAVLSVWDLLGWAP